MIKRMRSRKAQVMEMPFQFIFSIFLIAIFLVAAIIAIKSLLDSQAHAKIAAAYSEFEAEANSAYLSTSTEKTLHLDIPSSVKMICFSGAMNNIFEGDLSADEKLAYDNLDIYRNNDANFFFYPAESVIKYSLNPYQKVMCGQDKDIDCMDLSNLRNNFLCFANSKGIVTIVIEKNYGKDEGVMVKEK